jgi:hypothetical protein
MGATQMGKPAKQIFTGNGLTEPYFGVAQYLFATLREKAGRSA